MQLFHNQVSPDVAGLVDDYRTTLDSYVKDRSKNVATYNSLPIAKRTAEETIKQLDTLDVRRALLEKRRAGPRFPAANPAIKTTASR